MNRTAYVKYKNLDLEVKGYYSPKYSGTREQPPEPECFEITTIYWEDKDITPIFDELLNDWCGLEEVCLEYLKD